MMDNIHACIHAILTAIHDTLAVQCNPPLKILDASRLVKKSKLDITQNHRCDEEQPKSLVRKMTDLMPHALTLHTCKERTFVTTKGERCVCLWYFSDKSTCALIRLFWRRHVRATRYHSDRFDNMYVYTMIGKYD